MLVDVFTLHKSISEIVSFDAQDYAVAGLLLQLVEREEMNLLIVSGGRLAGGVLQSSVHMEARCGTYQEDDCRERRFCSR